MKKTAKNAGADNLTPSIPQYFSWINSTNEGSTEKQTLINLEFFKWLKDTFGMEIKIYAWDAGNFDGASEGYGDPDSEKFKSQYPEGYKNVVEKAREIGIRLGLWGSPDGFGNSKEEQEKRYNFFVHLCRDYNFALFKLDGVCGHLRVNKAQLFAKMLRECREYSPDLIILNHRLNLYCAEKHITTYLWEGGETYTDILIHNQNTAMHNRAYMFTRGLVKNLDRLAEDHGVCISSCIDYFEDELIYQAFSRALILAPEIYGNPWLMKDCEFPRLARIYNLHKKIGDIIVNGMVLPLSYGKNAVSRGDEGRRFIVTGNNSWDKKNIVIKLDGEIGLAECEKVCVNIRHPYEKHVGVFNYGESVEIEAMPFRALFVEVCRENTSLPVLTNCEYELIKENEKGEPLQVKILKTDGGEITLLSGGEEKKFITSEKTDIKEKAPIFLGSLKDDTKNPSDGEQLYEAAMFSISNDALEYRSLLRAGETKIPAVKAARDAFFEQKTYKLRGCEARNLFDLKQDTFFDGQSRYYTDGFRIDGGCLRIDFGGVCDADRVEIEYFSAKEIFREVGANAVPLVTEYSLDLKEWKNAGVPDLSIVQKDFVQEFAIITVHTIDSAKGEMVKITYNFTEPFRYIRIPDPMDRIYAVRFIKNGKEIKPERPFANNLQAHYGKKRTRLKKSGKIFLPEFREGSFLAVGVEGRTGNENGYCVAEIDGELFGFPRRAPEYRANVWEHTVVQTDRNYTYYLPLKKEWIGKTVNIHCLLSGAQAKNEIECNAYLCDKH